ncbi:DUF2303 family protein [Roseovarius sp. B08]|uniref:DUF2303 family protein n=1 Tax=Roseovarius sp. B08 TaxID=3449223 RepID=UPI003EDC7537
MAIEETDDTTRENIAQTMRDTMQNLMPHEPIEEPNGNPFTTPHQVETAKDRQIHDLTEQRRNAAQFFKPARRKGTAHMSDLDSFIAWANRFKGDTSAMFAKPDMESPALTCIADYHGEGPAEILDPEGDSTARHLHHRAIYNFPLSDEWKAWMQVSGKPLGKDELGEFIEEQAKDIQDPTPAILKGKPDAKAEAWENRMIETAMKIEGKFGQLRQLLDLTKNFQVFETSNLKASTNRDTGESEIQFLNEHRTPDGKPLKLPNLIIIAIPVFRNGALFRMPVRFRYRKSGSTVGFILTIYNPHKAFDLAFDEALDTAKEQTELPLFKGSPESA